MKELHPAYDAVPLSDESVFQWESGTWTGKTVDRVAVSVLRNTNFTDDGRLDFSDVARIEIDARHLARKLLRPGDIVLERSGGGPKQPVGRVALFEEREGRFSFSNFTSRLRVVATEVFNPRFVHLFLHNFHLSGGTLTLQQNTTGIRNLRFADYQRVRVPRLPIEEQDHLVDTLAAIQRLSDFDSRDEACFRELKAALADRLFRQGVRGEALRDTEIGQLPASWGLVTLGSMLESMNYGTSARCGREAVGVPVIRIPNVVDETIDVQDLKYAVLPPNERAKLQLLRGDLIFVRTNGNREYTGRCAVYDGSPPNAAFASYLIRARLRVNTLIPDFVKYYLSHTGRHQITGRANPAADGKFNIDTGILKTTLIPHPSLDEQSSIVEILKAVDRRIRVARQATDLGRELFVSLLASEIASGGPSSKTEMIENAT